MSSGIGHIWSNFHEGKLFLVLPFISIILNAVNASDKMKENAEEKM